MRWLIESCATEKETRDVIMGLRITRQGLRVTSNFVLFCLTLVNRLEKIRLKYYLHFYILQITKLYLYLPKDLYFPMWINEQRFVKLLHAGALQIFIRA